jgi:type IV pilus assembly protein PilW
MYRQKGLSLVELMVAIALGLVLMGGVIQLFLSSRIVFSTQQALSRVQENGRFAIEFITRDLRQAGYTGCTSRNLPVMSDLAGAAGLSFWNAYTLPSDAMLAVQGFEDAITGVTLAPAPLSGDILVVRYADGVPSVLAADNTVAGQLSLRGSLANGCLNGLCQNTTAIVSNCVGARIFRVASLATDGANVRLNHGGPWPGAFVSTSGNFVAGGEVLPMFTVAYYVANNPSGQPSLYRAVNGVNGIEMVEGVERMVLRFRHENGDYLESSEVTNWALINGVRVELLLQANENNMLDEAQTYTLGGEETDSFADRRYRQVFGTTVAVRSRI